MPASLSLCCGLIATGCGDLSDQTDCACNVHAAGGHLLCHDDVIGNRRVSYIIYLTGGAAAAHWRCQLLATSHAFVVLAC